MILDTAERIGGYAPIVPHLAEELEFLKSHPYLSEGTHPFPGGRIVFFKGVTESVQDKPYETHRKYIDVMLVKAGQEYLGYCPFADLQTPEEYQAQEDCQLFPLPQKGRLLKITEGCAYILFPGEGHQPAVHLDTPFNILKIIIKCSVAD